MQILTIRPKIGQKIETQAETPIPVPVDESWHQAATELSGKLAENSAEADRMTYAGRSPQALRSAKTFDETRVESMPLFHNAKRQGGLFK